MGFDEKVGLKAMTGFQVKSLEREFLVDELNKRISSDGDKRFEFIENRLRNASDIFEKGGHVMPSYRDKSFSIEYDNKRRVVGPWSLSSTMYDTVPWFTINDYRKIRVLKDTVNTPVFVKGAYTTGGVSKAYKSTIETSIRAFIKAAFSDSERFGIPVNEFKTYKNIIDFIHGYDLAKGVKLTKTGISNLKCRKTISRTVPRTKETEGFVEYVKEHIKEFDSDRFFKNRKDEEEE